jgi:RNase P/RNase MRP subunit POP5
MRASGGMAMVGALNSMIIRTVLPALSIIRRTGITSSHSLLILTIRSSGTIKRERKNITMVRRMRKRWSKKNFRK